MRARAFVWAMALPLLSACGSAFRPYPLSEPLWRDPDRHPFGERPAEYYSALAWDGANQTVFRPLTELFAVDTSGEATNVNALDEVPDSSWFENRLTRYAMTPDDVARGPCRPPDTDPKHPWTVTGAKPNGNNPGFLIEDAEGKRYLVKFDGDVQGPRATAADVVVSKLYHAAGFRAPCNQIVFFDRERLQIAPDATGEDSRGRKVPLTESHLDRVFDKALRLADGRYRASASLFVDGKPLGPFRYQGTRDDDPNDVVAHEDRRELRGMRLLAAWTNHFDSREQNTLDTWIEVDEKDETLGYVRHNIIDFGDCFGSVWEPPMLGRRLGHAYYFDPGYIAEDFLTFGIVERPWDRERFGPTGKVLGYYDVEEFDPERWRPGYPNPAFSRMTERDAAWMARIIAKLTDAHLRRVVGQARFTDERISRELLRILIGRRDRILDRYLAAVSPLTDPVIEANGPQGYLCLRDALVDSPLHASMDPRRYSARAWVTLDRVEAPLFSPHVQRGRVCTQLPAVVGASPEHPRYVVVDVFRSGGVGVEEVPARAHLYHLGGPDYQVVALERPSSVEAPGG